MPAKIDWRQRADVERLGRRLALENNPEATEELEKLDSTELAEVKQALAQEASAGKANAGIAYINLLKYMDAKKTVTQGKEYSADDIAIIARKAIAELRRRNVPVDAMSPVSQIFLSEIRDDKGRPEGDYPLHGVEASDGVTGHVPDGTGNSNSQSTSTGD